MSNRNDWAICLYLVGSPEKAIAPHTSTLAWKIPWVEEPGRLQSMGWRRVGDDFTFTFTFPFHFQALEKEMATHSSVLAWRIPESGEPGRLPSLGSHRAGHDWSDLAAAAAVGSLVLNHMIAAGFWEGRTIPKLRAGESSVLLHPMAYSGHKANPQASHRIV